MMLMFIAGVAVGVLGTLIYAVLKAWPEDPPSGMV